MKSIHSIAFLALITLIVASCKKDKQDQPVPAAPALLSIKVSQPYLPIGQVDSAFAIWTLNGHEQRIKLNKSNDSLLAPLSQFHDGSGSLVLHIYANKKFGNQYNSEFILKKNISIQQGKAVGYAGPASFSDESWFPRVDLKDAVGHRAIVALRPEDPYFIVKDPGHAMQTYTVDRGYWKTVGGIALAGRDVWTCTTGCTDVPNEQHFTTLPGRIGTKPWNHISIVVLFEVDDNGGWILDFEYDL